MYIEANLLFERIPMGIPIISSIPVVPLPNPWVVPLPTVPMGMWVRVFMGMGTGQLTDTHRLPVLFPNYSTVAYKIGRCRLYFYR
jgi:hypothetical protein